MIRQRAQVDVHIARGECLPCKRSLSKFGDDVNGDCTAHTSVVW
jgi:hypothetical protein